MRDTYRRYRAIQQAIRHCYPPRPTGQREPQRNTLVAWSCGLTGGQRAQLSTIADHAPRAPADQQRVIARFRRWLNHDGQTVAGWCLPVAKALLANLAQQPRLLVRDGRVVGRGCIALMLRVVYHGRALPVAWVVVQGKQGPVPPATQCAWLEQIQPRIPPPAAVTVLGDGEVDGTDFQAVLRRLQWQYVCRTAPNLLMTVYGKPLPSGDLAPPRGEVLAVRPAWMTAAAYGPVSILAIGELPYDAPISLVTNMADVEAAVVSYRHRAPSETCCSDQTRRGFHLQTSQLTAPQRRAR